MPKTIEQIKTEGLALDLRGVTGGGFGEIEADDFYRLKTFGLCSPRKDEQDFMVRIRVPGGAATAAQVDRVAELADRYARGWVHLSTRQNFELHMVRAEDGPAVLEELERCGLTARSACGDTIRNIAACECSGFCQTQCVDVRPWTALVAAHVRAEAEYFDHHLPRKVNVYLADCADCAEEARLNDVGLVGALDERGRPGFALWVGGGQGGQHPMLAEQLRTWMPLEDTIPAIRAVLRILIDHGERKMRARSKLKFMLRDRGIGWLDEQFTANLVQERAAWGGLTPNDAIVEWRRAGITAALDAADTTSRPSPSAFEGEHLPHGAAAMPRRPGYYRVEIRVPMGEVRAGHLRAATAASRELSDARVYLTKRQNLELRWVPGDSVEAAVGVLQSHGMRLGDTGRVVDVAPCVGAEYCPIGLTSTQTVAAQLIERLEEAVPPSSEQLRVNLSACPNSCAQHWISEIGLSGLRLKTGGQVGPGYELMLGGATGVGARLGQAVGRVREEHAAAAVEAAMMVFGEARREAETMGDVVDRLGLDQLGTLIAERLPAGVLLRAVEVPA
ncbi:MAG: nitrite/sulfite reductase [Chloroflexota bacterium]